MDGQEQLRGNLRRLDEVVSEAAAYFRQHEDKQATTGAPWGAREVLAHMLFWHEWTCQSVEDVLAGKAPYSVTRPVDETNDEAIAAQRGQSMNALVDQLVSLQRRLSSDLEAMADPNTIVLIRANGQQVTAAQRPETMALHIASHLAELRNG